MVIFSVDYSYNVIVWFVPLFQTPNTWHHALQNARHIQIQSLDGRTASIIVRNDTDGALSSINTYMYRSGDYFLRKIITEQEMHAIDDLLLNSITVLRINIMTLLMVRRKVTD